MCLTTENISGVIKCPHKDCEELYSILSPIYREYGFPKRIDLMISQENKTCLFSGAPKNCLSNF